MMRFSLAAMVTAFLFTVLPSRASAQQSTAWAHIVQVRAGLVEDAMAVFTTNTTVLNPGNCKATDAGYQTIASDPGHKLFQTLLMSAYLNGKQVQLTIQGCAYDKPRIIGVSIKE
jgi:hypothetical protein